MRKYFFLIIIICVSLILAFISCQKKIVGYVEVSGRVIDYLTGLPLSSEISLYTDDVSSSKSSARASIHLATVHTKSDGTFTLRTKPSKISAYYLRVDGIGYKGINSSSSISISENQPNDIGDIIAGKHTFTCNITFIPVSDSCLDLSIPSGYFHLNPGQNLQYTHSQVYYQYDYIFHNYNYYIHYLKNDCIYTHSLYSESYNISIPINTLTGVMSTTISY